MAEVIAVVGLAASIVNLIDGCSSFIQQINDTRQLLRYQSGLEHLDDELASLTEILSQLQVDLKAGSVDEKDVETVEKRVSLCVGAVQNLKRLLDKVSTLDGDSRTTKTGKFLLSIAKAKEVATLEGRIRREKEELQFVLQNVTRKSISKTFDKVLVTDQKVDGVITSVEQVQESVVHTRRDSNENAKELQTSLKRTEGKIDDSLKLLGKDDEILSEVQQAIRDLPGEIILELARRPDLIRQHLELIETSSNAPNHTKNLTAFPRQVDRRTALRRYCGSRCPCSCHSQAEWSLMKGMSINSFGFRSLFSQQCDVPACRPARLASVDLKFFPPILKFALRASLAFDFGNGFSVSPTLHFRRVLNWDADLFVASRIGDFAKVRRLIETGQASATDSDDIGWTSMHCAADNGHLDIARYLAEKGGDLNEVTLYNESPTTLSLRHIAKGSSKTGDRSACDIVQYFYDESDGLENDSSLSTMSAYADLGHLMEKFFQLDRPKMRFLEQVDFRYEYGCTALAIAIILRDTKLATEQLSLGADPCAVNQWNQSILHLASRHGFLLAELLETAAIKDLNALDDFNQTPLITAARSGSLEVVIKLLEVFPDAHCKSAGTSYNALHWAVLSGNSEVVKAIATYDASPAHLDTTGWLGRTPILDAATTGNTDVLKELFDAGCNAQICDSEGNRVLHLAGNAATARFIASAGFDIDARGARGRTPVMSALLGQRTDVADLLIQSGADLELKDHSGWSTLHYALQVTPTVTTQSSSTALLKRCIKHGANPHAVDNCMCPCSLHGCSPATFALQHGRIKQWTSVLDELNLAKKPMTQFVTNFRDFERQEKLHTCCQGSLFVLSYQHQQTEETESAPRVRRGFVEDLREDDAENPLKERGDGEHADEDEDEEVFHDANEAPVYTESQMDISLQKRIASMNRAGCSTILLHQGGKRMRVDVQALVGFKDWEVLLDV